jgi:undecaprenyl diphosphate synthase
MFAFSSENWQRPRDEVKALMALFAEVLKRETADLHKNGVRLRFIGDRASLGKRLTKRIEEAEALTASNAGLKLDIAMAYGGRWDIVQAARHLAEDIMAGRLASDDITETTLADRLVTGDAPEPDLLIRTGGEQRISNFLLWQGAYAELFFSQALWPDFSDREVDEALEFYSVRQRRFGRTGEQVGVKPC